MTLRLALLASGSGRTVQNLIDRWRDGRLCAEPVVVLSSRRSAGVVARAERAGLPVIIHRKRRKHSVAEFSQRLFAELAPHKPDLLCLAGFVHLIEIPDAYDARVINIHPSLIPAFCGQGFYGQTVHEAVREAGVGITGCSVHFCDNIYDHGPIILQRAVPVLSDDQVSDIARRVFSAELVAYPEAINLLARGRVTVVNGRCHIRRA